jgi:hypothetical protein
MSTLLKRLWVSGNNLVQSALSSSPTTQTIESQSSGRVKDADGQLMDGRWSDWFRLERERDGHQHAGFAFHGFGAQDGAHVR